MLTRMFSAMPSISRPFTGGVVALALLGAAVSFEPAHGQEGGMVVLNCVGSGFAISCVKRWGSRPDPYVRRLVPRDPQEEAESAERERKWAARCRPVMKQDRYGVSRYEYAAQGCEFGKTQD
jgi:hypothetical protein